MCVAFFLSLLFSFSLNAMTVDLSDLSFDDIRALYKDKERFVGDVLSPIDAANLSRFESDLQYVEARIDSKEWIRDVENPFLKRDLERELDQVHMNLKYIYIRGLNELSKKECEEEQRKKAQQARAEAKINKQKRLADLVKGPW